MDATNLGMDEAARFQHQQLDQTQASIRLVHLQRTLSPGGLLSCTITHTTIDASYVCLSYRWGDLDPASAGQILLSGKPYSVQKNLLDFLQHMLSVAPPEDPIFDPAMGYWIDALCIDQKNTSERNHQVAQMGSIFSQAEYVHLWLGTTPDAGRLCQLLDGPTDEKGMGARSMLVRQDMDFIERHIFRNQYWTRAWVVQEVVLARRVEISLGAQRFSMTTLVRQVRRLSLDWFDTHFEQFGSYLEGYVQIRGQPLITLLDHFHEKECGLVIDRVFSLVSLSNEDKSARIDYNMSRCELAEQILRSHLEELCICSAVTVARSLELHTDDASSFPPLLESSIDIDLTDYELEWHRNVHNVCYFMLKHPTSCAGADVRSYGNNKTYCSISLLVYFSEVLLSNEKLRLYMTTSISRGQPVLLQKALDDIWIAQQERGRFGSYKCIDIAPLLLVRFQDIGKMDCIARIALRTLARDCFPQLRLCGTVRKKECMSINMFIGRVRVSDF